MRILNLTKETKTIFRKFIKRSPNSYGEFEDALILLLKTLEQIVTRLFLNIQNSLMVLILMRQIF